MLVGALVSLCGHHCRAELIAAASASNRVTSEVLFERGRSLFIEGRFVEACPLLEESQRFAPGIGVLLHLGACFEKLGKTASAWATFQEAADRAGAEGDKERESMARLRAAQLRERLSYLTLRLHYADSADQASLSNLPKGVQLQRDGNAVSISMLGLEEPVDPGPHTIIIRVPGMLDATRDVTLSDGQRMSIDVDLLPVPKPPAVTAMTSVTPPRHETPLATMQTSRASEAPNAWPWVAWTSVGIGTVALVTGAAAGLVAYAKMQDARALCSGYPKDQCPQESVRLQEQARLPADMATAGVAVGVGCLAFAGGYWLVARAGRTVVTGSISAGNSFIAVQTRW